MFNGARAGSQSLERIIIHLECCLAHYYKLANTTLGNAALLGGHARAKSVALFVKQRCEPRQQGAVAQIGAVRRRSNIATPTATERNQSRRDNYHPFPQQLHVPKYTL